MMITFFFQSYTITVITLETSSSFSGQVILTVFGDISSFEPLDFERAIFEEEAAVFRLTIWVGAGGGCCWSIVPHTADLICYFHFFFDDTGGQW